jgi:hypothetical protein
MFTLIKRRQGGWNAFYRGRRMLIQASEAQDEEQARQLAIRFFGIPRRSQSAVTVTPTFLEAAQSPEQQRFFGLVLAYKKGEVTKSEVSDDVVTAADNMTLDQIKKYAGTKHSEIKERINKNMNAFKHLVLEKLNSKIQNEKNEYQKFFKKKLDDEDKSIPDMSDQEKKDFFDRVSSEWSKIKDKVDESEYKTSAEQKLSEKKKKYSEISKDELDELFNELALEYSDLDEAMFKKGQTVKDFEGNVGEIINISSDKSTIDVKLNTGETVSYNTVDLSIFRESQVDEEIAGWIAIFKGKRLEIDKSEAKDLYGAKQLAIKKLNVPKSQTGLLSIAPAYNENTIKEQPDPAGWIAVYAGKRIEIEKNKFVDTEEKAKQQAIRQLKIPRNRLSRLELKPFFAEATVKTGKTFNETFYSIKNFSAAEYKPAEADSSYVDSTNRWIDKLYNSEKDKAEPKAAGEKGFKSFHDLVVDVISNPSMSTKEYTPDVEKDL